MNLEHLKAMVDAKNADELDELQYILTLLYCKIDFDLKINRKEYLSRIEAGQKAKEFSMQSFFLECTKDQLRSILEWIVTERKKLL